MRNKKVTKLIRKVFSENEKISEFDFRSNVQIGVDILISEITETKNIYLSLRYSKSIGLFGWQNIFFIRKDEKNIGY